MWSDVQRCHDATGEQRGCTHHSRLDFCPTHSATVGYDDALLTLRKRFRPFRSHHHPLFNGNKCPEFSKNKCTLLDSKFLLFYLGIFSFCPDYSIRLSHWSVGSVAIARSIVFISVICSLLGSVIGSNRTNHQRFALVNSNVPRESSPQQVLSRSQSYSWSSPPIAFIFVIVGIILLALLLLLILWCVHRRTTRQKLQSADQHRKSCSSIDQIIDSEPKSSLYRITTSSPNPEQTSPTTELPSNSSTTWIPRCLACCPTSSIQAPDLDPPFESNETHVKSDSPILSGVVESRSDLVNRYVSTTFGVHRDGTTDLSQASCSPSLATRRHVAPLPKLMTAAILSPYPPIETCVYAVQPTQSACAPPTVEPPILESTVQPEASAVYTTPRHSLSQTSSLELGPNNRALLASNRTRTRGLLESRRGSHTSLTLSLSPLTGSPITTAYYSAGLSTNTRGVSLDDHSAGNAHGGTSAPSDTVLLRAGAPDECCHSARSAVSEGHTEYFTSQPPHLGLKTSTTTALQTYPEHEDGISSKTDMVGSNRREQAEPRRHAHPCSEHPMLYRRLHCHPTHHRCIETGQPCPHMTMSYQRIRDLEQLANASQPLTYEQLVRKLRDSNAALFQEFWNIPMNHASKKELPIAGIGQKNRYQSILPNYSTRVVLPTINNDPLSAYINANYIRGYGGRPNAFIATQGPMSHTVVDFWRMIWHCNSPAIVMITRLVEKQGVKCELYLPNTPSDDPMVQRTRRTVASHRCADSPHSASHSSPSQSTPSPAEDSGIASREETSDTKPGLDSVDLLVSLPNCAQTFGEIYVQVLSLQRCEGYTVRRLLLRKNSEERDVFHFWYTAWPDHSSPETGPASARQLLQLVRAVESCRPKPVATENSAKTQPNDRETSQGITADGPIVVHCSAGLGRTGCFIALCIGCDQLEREGVVDVLRIVSRLRLDRGGMVQTNEQYEFIHHALAAFPSSSSLSSMAGDFE